MNFILTTRYNDTWWAVPLDKKKEIAVQLYAFAEKYVATGNFKESYTFPDARIMSVWNVDSFEEMMTVCLQHPYLVNHYADYELAPVVDHKGMDRIIASFGKAS